MRRTTKAFTVLAPLIAGAIVAVTVATGPAPSAVAAPPFSAADVTDELVAGGNWRASVAADWMSDGRMLVVRTTGEVMVVNPATSVSTNLFTVPNLLTLGESGLLDVAVDKGFASNGFFYTYSVNGTSRRPQVDRFVFSASGAAVLASRRTIWTAPGPAAPVCCNYHVGGSVTISPDNKLYVTIGDNQEGSNAQSLTNVFGKVLRINLDGTVPADNPYVDGAGPRVDEIWAYGLRNPFRASFDSASGQYWVGDVGGNVDTTAYEEVDVVVRGANYGWPNCEGPLGPPKNGPSCPAGTAGPLYSYSHNLGQACCGNKAIIGGDVYRGASFPAAFRGTYIYADYPTGVFYWVESSGGSATAAGELKRPSIGGANPTWIGVSPFDGHIYWLHYGWSNDGQLRRMRYNATGARPPVITQASATPTSGPAPLAVAFSATATDPDGDAVTYSWDFNNDGTTDSNVRNPTFTYATDGQYNARLVVRAGGDLVAAPLITISVGAPPTATITGAPATFVAGQTIALSGTGSPGTTLTWTVTFRHNEHTHPVVTGTGPTFSFPVETAGHTWDGNTSFEVTLTATSPSGLTGSATRTLLPQKRSVPVGSNVAGLEITVDGIARTTPTALDTIVGFRHAIVAPATACDGLTRWTFSSWSSGASRIHTFTVPDGAASLTANYVPTGSCAPSLYRAINLNGPAVNVDGVQFESGIGAPNLTAGPGTFCSPSAPLIGNPSAGLAQMLRCSVWGDGDPGATVSISGIPNGTYLASVWVWEDNTSQSFDLLFNGSIVTAGAVSGPAGSWQRLGPFPVAIAGGTLQITSRGGAANVSGVRIDRPVVESSPPTPGQPSVPTVTTEIATMSPVRLLDTRPGMPPTVDGLAQGFGPLALGSVTELQVTGRAGVPADATAAVLNVTVTEAEGPGYLTVFPCGSPVPNAANLNYLAGDTIPNAVLAKIGDGGKVCIYTINTTHVVADLNGWFPAPTSYIPEAPIRLLDTRPGMPPTVDGLAQGFGPLALGSVTELQVTGRAGIPADAAAAVLNVTVTEAEGPGYLTVFPCGSPVPNAANLNYLAGDTIPNAVLAKIGDGGKVCIYTINTTHVVADLNGWFPAPTTYTAVAPARLLDTRPGMPPTVDGLAQGFGPLALGSVTEFQVTGRAGVPADATAAVLNVTVTEAEGPGYLTVFPCGSPVPNAANLNYLAGDTIPNAVLAKIGDGGKVCIYTINTTHVVADLNGWFPAG